MARTGTGSDFSFKVNKIVNYFARTRRGGFLFYSSPYTIVIPEINRVIIQQAKAKDMDIMELHLELRHGEGFLQEIRAAANEHPDGIIIANLDQLISLTNDQVIKDINLARDILLGLKSPLLFCMLIKNISKFANLAQDLFSRRERGVINFSGELHELASMKLITALERMGYQPLTGLLDRELKIEILEDQLKEAEDKKHNPGRIANDIVWDLIRLYLSASLFEKANDLFEKYKSHLPSKVK